MTPEPTDALVERVRQGLKEAWIAKGNPNEVNGKALVALTELAERLRQAEDAWQRAEHPFDKAEFDAMAERVKAAERETTSGVFVYTSVNEKALARAVAAEAQRDEHRAEHEQAEEALRIAREERDELVEALEEIEGYESRMGDYSEPEAYGVAFDCGEIARAALAKHRDLTACACVGGDPCPCRRAAWERGEPWERDRAAYEAGEDPYGPIGHETC